VHEFHVPGSLNLATNRVQSLVEGGALVPEPFIRLPGSIYLSCSDYSAVEEAARTRIELTRLVICVAVSRTASASQATWISFY